MYVYDKMYKELTRDATSVEDQEARIGNACMECVKLMFPVKRLNPSDRVWLLIFL